MGSRAGVEMACIGEMGRRSGGVRGGVAGHSEGRGRTGPCEGVERRVLA